MTHLLTLFLLATPASAQIVQSTGPAIASQLFINQMKGQLANFMVGHSTVTGTPTFQNGICFGDGSCQTVAAASGGGTSSNNVWTASNTWGYAGGLTSTASYTAACIGTAGGCLVAITSVTAQQSLWFYNLYATTVTYRVEYELTNNTGTSQVGVQFNLDTGANYASLGYCTNPVAANPLQLSGQTSIFLADNSNQVNSGVTLTGGFNFKSPRAAPNSVAVYNASSVYPNANLEGCNNTGYYGGSAALRTIRIFSVSQTLTGMARLYASLISQSSN